MSSSTKTRRLLMMGGVLLSLIVFVFLVLLPGRYVSGDNAYVRADRVWISSKVSGQVISISAHENEDVDKGDVLFEIDPAPYRIALEKAQVNQDKVRSTLEAVRNSHKAAEAHLSSAQAALDYALKFYNRQADMHARGLLPAQLLDDANREVAEATASKDESSAEVAKAANLFGAAILSPVKESAFYRLAVLDVEQATLDLANTRITSPVRGAVGKQALQPGTFVSPGQPVLPLIVADTWRVEANLKETDVTYVRPGQAVSISLDAYPDKVWKGHVESISPASGAEFSVIPAQNATGNWVKIVQRISVRIAFEKYDPLTPLRSGMSASVSIDTGPGHAIWRRWFGLAR